MAWSQVPKAPLLKSLRKEPPEDLWFKCQGCSQVIYRKDFELHLHVCPKCEHHYPLAAWRRIESFCDGQSFFEEDGELRSQDPLGFVDKKSYKKRLEELYKNPKFRDGVITGRGLLKGRPIQLVVFDFEFMGGSMGSVVGEKIARAFQRGAKAREPVVVFSTSGGARMQEGILSLMQMAKTCAALSLPRDARVPLISVMTHPTTGGVAASYAMLGDVNIGEPGALIGFAGPRVIAQTIGQNLPEGFQTSEYLLQHGMLDMICARNQLRNEIYKILSMLLPS